MPISLREHITKQEKTRLHGEGQREDIDVETSRTGSKGRRSGDTSQVAEAFAVQRVSVFIDRTWANFPHPSISE